MAGVQFIQVGSMGLEGLPGRFVYMQCNDTLDTILAPGYLDSYLRTFGIKLLESDTVFCLMYNQAGLPTSKKLLMLNVRFVNGAYYSLTKSLYANSIDAGNLKQEVLRYSAVNITASEFNGMFAAPKLLVAAPDADELLVLDKVQLLMTYNSAAYANGGVAAIQYDSTIEGAGVIASSTLAAASFQATASTAWNFNAGVVPETFSTCVNKGLYLSNVTGAFTTGNSAMVAHIWYKIIPTI